MKFALTILIAFFSIQLTGQIKFDVKISDRNVGKLQKMKGSRAKLEGYKKFYSKDSISAAKQAWTQYRRDNKDSLKAKGLWKEARINKHKILTNRWRMYPDPVSGLKVPGSEFPPPKDSLDWALQELARQGNYEELQTVYSAYAQYDSAYLSYFHPDSMRVDSQQLAERFNMKQRISSYLPDDLTKETDMDMSKRIQAGAIDGYGNVTKIDRSGVKNFLKNVSPEQLSKSQVSMTALKKKYAALPGLEKKNEGIKRKSLEGKSLKERMYLSGNFTLRSLHPLIIGSDIRGGYRFNRAFSAGAGLILREQFNNSTSTNLTGDAHGYAFFVSYEILHSYFLYGEYQALKNKSLFEESVKPVRWQYAHLLGGGREFKFSRTISGSFSLLYDFNYKKNDLNGRPLVFRFGYKIRF